VRPLPRWASRFTLPWCGASGTPSPRSSRGEGGMRGRVNCRKRRLSSPSKSTFNLITRPLTLPSPRERAGRGYAHGRSRLLRQRCVNVVALDGRGRSFVSTKDRVRVAGLTSIVNAAPLTRRYRAGRESGGLSHQGRGGAHRCRLVHVRCRRGRAVWKGGVGVSPLMWHLLSILETIPKSRRQMYSSHRWAMSVFRTSSPDFNKMLSSFHQ
jgi:hypothetical protein